MLVRIFLPAGLLLMLLAVPGAAQSVAPNHRHAPDAALNTADGATLTPAPVAKEKADDAEEAAAANRAKSYVAKLQRRKALLKLLASLGENAPERATLEAVLAETEAEIQALEADILNDPASGEDTSRPPAERLPGEGRPAAIRRNPPATRRDATDTARPPVERSTERAPTEMSEDTVEPVVRNPGSSSRPPGSDSTPTPVTPGSTATTTATATATAQQNSNFDRWLNQRFDDVTKALIDQGSNANQTESPSLSDASTSLVDQSSASDLIGVALNLAGLTDSGDDDNESNSVAVTASAYSLYAALNGANPLDPTFYNQHRDWRRFSFTLGFEDEQPEGSAISKRATVTGIKFLAIAGRDASRNRAELDTIRTHLRNVAESFGRVDARIKPLFIANPQVRDRYVRSGFVAALPRIVGDLDEAIDDFNQQITAAGTNRQQVDAIRVNLAEATRQRARAQELQTRLASPTATLDSEQLFVIERMDAWSQAEKIYFLEDFSSNVLLNDTVFPQVLELLTDADKNEINDAISRNINPFVKLRESIRGALERIRSKPQFSLAFNSKNREDMGDDEYKFEAIYERGLTNRVNFTFNGAFNYLDKKIIGGDSRGGTAAAQFRFQLTPENSLISKSPIYLTFAGDAKWMSSLKPIYRAQAKVKFPIMDGIELPVSFTYSNRTELIDESDVRGQFGFTFDTSKLLRAFLFKAPSIIR